MTIATDDYLLLSEEQRLVIDKVERFARGEEETLVENEFRLGGLAGTGKTTILKTLLARNPGWVCGCPIGRAAANLRRKGIAHATTIHKLCYVPDVLREKHEKHGEVERLLGFNENDKLGGKCIVVDESSMLTGSMYDLLRSRFDRMIFVGDFGQLPPVFENDYDPAVLTQRDATLQTIHRQGADSPIIELAYKLRSGDQFWAIETENTPGVLEIEQVGRGDIPTVAALGSDIILCAFNNTRHKVNDAVRARLGFSGILNIGEKVVAMQNSHSHRIMNGQTFTVDDVIEVESEHVWHVQLLDDEGEFHCIPIWMGGFEERDRQLKVPYAVHFNYGYCLTVHKALGSEWKHVAVVDEISRWFEEKIDDPLGKRWRYTAATRAAEHLTYLKGHLS